MTHGTDREVTSERKGQCKQCKRKVDLKVVVVSNDLWLWVKENSKQELDCLTLSNDYIRCLYPIYPGSSPHDSLQIHKIIFFESSFFN